MTTIDEGSGAFERHLREAIGLNESRAGFYASMSAGASLAVTRRLVRIERMLLPFAHWMDRRASKYHALDAQAYPLQCRGVTILAPDLPTIR